LSDIHYGSKGTNYDKFETHCEIARTTPNFFVATNGDHVDNFSPTVLPSGMLENPITPDMQVKAFVKMMQRLDNGGNIGWMNIGNHDDWIGAAGYSHETSLANIQAPIIDRIGKIHIPTLGGAKYTGIVAHQYWGASKLNITNAPKRLIEHEGAGQVDFGITGHTHQSSYEQFNKGGKQLTAIVAGAYKENDKWARGKGIGASPSEPGVTMVFGQDKKRIQVFPHPEDAQQFVLAHAMVKDGSLRADELKKFLGVVRRRK